MNRRDMLRRLAVGASGLVVAESVRDFMAWEAKRIFALGGVPCESSFAWGLAKHPGWAMSYGLLARRDGLWVYRDGTYTLATTRL